jgi:hypothetical protein
VTADAVRDFLTHLAVHRRVSASTQNQAQSAVLFLCREVAWRSICVQRKRPAGAGRVVQTLGVLKRLLSLRGRSGS